MKRLAKVGDWVYSLFHEKEGVVVEVRDVPDQWDCESKVLLVGRDTPNPAHIHSLRVIRRAEVNNEKTKGRGLGLL